MSNSKIKRSIFNLFKSKKVNIGLIIISYLIIIGISIFLTKLFIEAGIDIQLSGNEIKYSEWYKTGKIIGHFLGSIIGMSAIPVVISLGLFIIKKFVFKKVKISFRSFFSWIIFIRTTILLFMIINLVLWGA